MCCACTCATTSKHLKFPPFFQIQCLLYVTVFDCTELRNFQAQISTTSSLLEQECSMSPFIFIHDQWTASDNLLHCQTHSTACYLHILSPQICLVNTLNSFDNVWLHCPLHLNTPLHSYDHQHILTITINTGLMQDSLFGSRQKILSGWSCAIQYLRGKSL